MTENVRKEINQFPSAILPKTVGAITGPKVYSMIDQHYVPARFNYFSDFNKETYNILVVGKTEQSVLLSKICKKNVLGPTGAGKSRLVNVLFNTEICESQVSHKSVTRDFCFIEGQGEIIDLKTSVKQMKKVVVADTVGLCDTEWDDRKILAFIKGRVGRKFKYIDAAFIVFKADRLSKEHVINIKEIMKWLNYNRSNHLSFLFVGMCAENLCPLTKENLKKQAREMLGLIDTKLPGNEYESLVYVGFPPEDQLNDNGKKMVEKSWDLLQPLVRLNENSMQLKDYKLHVANQTFWKLPRIFRICTIL